MSRMILTLGLDGVAFRAMMQMRRGSTKIPVRKHIALGLGLSHGQPAYGYVGRDLVSNRPVLVFYADGKDREGKEHVPE
jgi:hypothetical protein